MYGDIYDSVAQQICSLVWMQVEPGRKMVAIAAIVCTISMYS